VAAPAAGPAAAPVVAEAPVVAPMPDAPVLEKAAPVAPPSLGTTQLVPDATFKTDCFKEAAKELPKESPSVVSTTDTLTPAASDPAALGSTLQVLPEVEASKPAAPGKKSQRRSAVMDMPPAPQQHQEEEQQQLAEPPALSSTAHEAATAPAAASDAAPSAPEPAAPAPLELPAETEGCSSSSKCVPATPEVKTEVVKQLQPWQILRQKALPPSRPEDNYEISEKGGDSDAEENDDHRLHKHIPAWCDSYVKQLKLQEDMDPDTIFGPRVPPCNLEEIFSDELYAAVGKNRPKRARGSSGDWKRDRLQKEDVTKYKSRMGHVRSWTELPKAPGSAAVAGR